MKNLIRQMLRIRMVEEEISKRYADKEMQTPIHLCIGQEAIAVGVCAALRDSDYICSNHRGHGHYLAKGGDLKAMIAELHGRATGCSRGYGGSMHLIDPDHGNFGHSAIVAGGISHAVGLALAAKMQKTDQIAVAFFGDGALDEGAFYEAAKCAIVWDLPVIFVIENNGVAVHSPAESRFPTKYKQLFFSGFWTVEDGKDLEKVSAAMGLAVFMARGVGPRKPSVLEFTCERWAQHVGPEIIYPENKDNCPIERMFKRWEHEFLVNEFDDMKQEIQQEINEAFEFALASPFPDSEQMYNLEFAVENVVPEKK